MRDQSAYPPPPGWGPPPRRSPSPWVWALAGCGGITLLVAAGIFFLVLKVSRTVGVAIQKAQAESETASRDLQVLDEKLTTFQGRRYIVGILKNRSVADTYENASVEFTLTDKQGEELDDSASDETDKPLKPGQTWRFKAEITSPQAAKYKLSDVSGYRTGAAERIFGMDSGRQESTKRGAEKGK
jgi:hypothetical protein